jgi:hypothetical protein
MFYVLDTNFGFFIASSKDVAITLSVYQLASFYIIKKKYDLLKQRNAVKFLQSSSLLLVNCSVLLHRAVVLPFCFLNIITL